MALTSDSKARVGTTRPVHVDVGDLYVSPNADESLVSYGLGSCLAVLIHDGVLHAGGMAHIQLPSTNALTSDTTRVWAAADRAIPELLQRMALLGAAKHRLRCVLAGAASVMDSNNFFQIGRKNYLAARQILWQQGVIIDAESVGGADWRTVSLEVGTGRITIRTAHGTEEL